MRSFISAGCDVAKHAGAEDGEAEETHHEADWQQSHCEYQSGQSPS
jgi:hypothetical protein